MQSFAVVQYYSAFTTQQMRLFWYCSVAVVGNKLLPWGSGKFAVFLLF